MPRSRSFVAGLTVAVVAMLATAAPASAHDDLLSSSPASEETLTETPSVVSLTFNADVLDMGAAVVVSDDGGTDWVSAAPAVDGPTVTAALDSDLPDGGYELRWRVVSGDGHPISGVVPFTVSAGKPAQDGPRDAGPATATPKTGSDEAGSGGSAENAEQDTTDPASTPQEGAGTQSGTQTQIAQEDEGPLRGVLVGAGGAAVAVALLALVQFLRRRSDADGADDTGDDPGSSGTA